MKDAGVNYATVQFPWPAVEPTPGVYQSASGRADFLRTFNFVGMGHALIFLTNSWSMTPDYIARASFEQFRDAVYPHVYSVVNANKQSVKMWNVFNEPMYKDSNIKGLTSEQTIAIIKEAAHAVRDADPEAKILINIFNVGAEIPGVDPYDFLKEVARSEVDYDAIGLQSYYNAYMRDGLNQMPRRTLAGMAELVDRYSAFGKDLLVTEFSVPSESTEGMEGYWDRPWSQELQAEYLRAAYTLFFSKPQVRGITWWDTSDATGPFIYHGALLDEQNRPKQSYYALKSLTEGWTTSGTGITDSWGQVSFRGFGGTYEVTVTDPGTGRSKKQEVRVDEQRNRAVVISFD